MLDYITLQNLRTRFSLLKSNDEESLLLLAASKMTRDSETYCRVADADRQKRAALDQKLTTPTHGAR